MDRKVADTRFPGFDCSDTALRQPEARVFRIQEVLLRPHRQGQLLWYFHRPEENPDLHKYQGRGYRCFSGATVSDRPTHSLSQTAAAWFLSARVDPGRNTKKNKTARNTSRGSSVPLHFYLRPRPRPRQITTAAAQLGPSDG